jgi:hypothetical protein
MFIKRAVVKIEKIISPDCDLEDELEDEVNKSGKKEKSVKPVQPAEKK